MKEGEVEKEMEKVLKIIIMKVENAGCVFSYEVDSKCPGDAWIVKQFLKHIEELGRRDIILKTDDEIAMVALQSAIAQRRAGITKPENPQSFIPSSIGACEKVVQAVSDQIRALTLALEARLGAKVEEDHPVMEWLIPHAA